MTMYKHKLIKIKDSNGASARFYVPGLVELPFLWKELKHYGFKLVKERLKNWTICWVPNEGIFNDTINALEELKKTRDFEYEVLCV